MRELTIAEINAADDLRHAIELLELHGYTVIHPMQVAVATARRQIARDKAIPGGGSPASGKARPEKRA